MKTVITLDPEYIPWEPGNPVVRLRRRRNKMLRAIMGIGFIIMLFGGMVFLAQQNTTITVTQPDLVAAPVPTAQPTPVAQLTPSLLHEEISPGILAILRGNVVMFYACDKYVMRTGLVVLTRGETITGSLFDMTGLDEVELECNDQKIVLR